MNSSDAAAECLAVQARQRGNHLKTLVDLFPELFSKVFEYSSSLIALFDQRSDSLIEVNQAFVRTLGYSGDEVIGKSRHQIEEILELGELLTGPLPPDEVSTFDITVRAKNGSLVEGLLGIRRVFLGEHALVIVEMQDITDRRCAERALEESEQRLERVLAGANLGSWDWNVQTGEMEFDERWCHMLGYEIGELEPHIDSWRRLAHPDDAPRVLAAVENHLAGESPEYETTHRLRTKSGRWIWVLDRGSITGVDAAHQPLLMSGTHMEITEREEALKVLERTAEENQRLADEARQDSRATLEHMVLAVTEAMGRMVEVRDPYTQGHQQRTEKVALKIAVEMGLSADLVETIQLAALVHDVGKLAVPIEILTKTGRLSPVEFGLIKEHPGAGYEILRGIDFPGPVAGTVLQHHERADGSGYPLGLLGDEIMPSARVLAVADAIEAMASARPYRPARGLDYAISTIKEGAYLFDAEVVAATVRLYEAGALDDLKETSGTFERDD